jgi:hypothetical protein
MAQRASTRVDFSPQSAPPQRLICRRSGQFSGFDFGLEIASPNP